MTMLNITAYKFISLTEAQLTEYRPILKQLGSDLEIRGSILLSSEGINLSLAGSEASIQKYIDYLNQHEKFNGMEFKTSFSNDYPFSRMIVRIKEEIIKMEISEIKPEQKTAPHLPAKQFKEWYEKQKDMIVIDTRNVYEVAVGTFKNAINLDIKNFHEFPEAIKNLPEEIKKKPIVTFCTGGVRCEKAAQYMLDQGFSEVYQLDGGIIKYFHECGDAFWQGECFVFDKRITISPTLNETETTQCLGCRLPIKAVEKTADGSCPHCQSHS